MKRNTAFLFFLIFFLLFTFNELFAQRGSRAQEVIEIRFASPLPRNSDWGRQLDRIAAEWARVTDNQVRVRIIHDGLEGGEVKMLSSLNADNIQAGLFLSTGLPDICPAAMTVSVPFLIKNDEELDLVLKDILPALDNQMNRTNFVAVTWSKGGWVYFFSKEAVLTPDELRRQKLGTSVESKGLNAVFTTMGFNAVEMGLTEIGTKFANNMVNSTYLLPEAIAPMGLHRYMNNMLDMPIAPFIGAIVMNRVTWNKLSPTQQTAIVNVTKSIVSEFESSITKTTANALTAMQRDGLKINKPTYAQEELWRLEAEKALPMLLGTTFDRAVYNQINTVLERIRNGR